jgi:hypothetical protein
MLLHCINPNNVHIQIYKYICTCSQASAICFGARTLFSLLLVRSYFANRRAQPAIYQTSVVKWRDSCIIWTNKVHYILLIYFNNEHLHDSTRLAAHHQDESHATCWLVAAASQHMAWHGILRLPRLRFFRAFSSVLRQMPGYISQRRGTVRTHPN